MLSILSSTIYIYFLSTFMCNGLLDDAREYIKALAPWIKDDQIEYDSEMNPVGVSGAHTPFPPFHWIVGLVQPSYDTVNEHQIKCLVRRSNRLYLIIVIFAVATFRSVIAFTMYVPDASGILLSSLPFQTVE